MEILLLRFDAPLMSFGAPIVDNRGVIQPYPALSMISGMLANALGYDHSEFDRLERLQERLKYASRQDRRGEKIQDFQTVDFRQEHLDSSRAWTTRGTLEGRSARLQKQTHIRRRDYWADAVHTVAVTVDPADSPPTVDDLADAVLQPERPLFIGRKTCLPATRLFLGRTNAPDLVAALRRAPLHDRADHGPSYRAWWPCAPGDAAGAEVAKPVTDRRDWRNQIHVGERWIAEGAITVQPEEPDDV
ncbi:MAG: type I-E CRISPR-associated protein Cas5/CasD [Persicimonas sp.]